MNNEPSTINYRISLQNIGRRFNRDWIFRGINYDFISGKSYAVLGPNGSGKSTLFQVVNGSLSQSAGKISYFYEDKPIEIDAVFKHISIAAPYLELIEEFSLNEMIEFHFKFKSYKTGIDKSEIINLLAMPGNKNKLIKYFSSGMKQRLKLALAFCSDTSILMVDEPTSNLDTQGIDWYLKMVQNFASNRLTIICSNQAHEYSFCDEQLNILDFKKNVT